MPTLDREICRVKAAAYRASWTSKQRTEKLAYQKRWHAARRADPELRKKDMEYAAAKQRVYREVQDADPVNREARLQRRRDLKAGAVLEREVEAHLVKRITALGGLCQKFIDAGRRGAPDRLVMVPGHGLVFVELKRPIGGEVSTPQRIYHADLKRVGQLVFILKSVTEVDEFMKRYD